MYWWGIVLLCILRCAAAADVVLESNVTTDCAGLPTTPVDIARLWTACAANPLCTQYYTQATLGSDLAIFTGLPPTNEAALKAVICGQTLEQIEDLMWVQALIIGGQSHTGCPIGEFYRHGKCVTQQNETLNDCWGYWFTRDFFVGIIVLLMTGGAVVVMLQQIIKYWNKNRL